MVQSGILTGVMVIFLQIVKMVVANFVNMQSFLGVFLQGGIAGLGALGFYLGLSYFFNVNESKILFNIVGRKLKSFKAAFNKLCSKKE